MDPQKPAPAPKPKVEPQPAPLEPPGLPRVKIKWAKGGRLEDGRIDLERGVIYTTRSRGPVIVSIHSGVVEWSSLV